MNAITFYSMYSGMPTSSGVPIYLEDEQSLSYVPFDQTADYTIMLGSSYIGLDVNSQTGLVSHISGFLPQHKWIKRTLHLPKAPIGKLYAQLRTPMIKGGGMRYKGEWPIYYCPPSRCLCIGNPTPTIGLQSVQFCNGTIAELDNSQIVSLWVFLQGDKGTGKTEGRLA